MQEKEHKLPRFELDPIRCRILLVCYAGEMRGFIFREAVWDESRVETVIYMKTRGYDLLDLTA